MRNLIVLKVICSLMLILAIAQLVLLWRVDTRLGIVSTKAKVLGEKLDREMGELDQGWVGIRQDWAEIEDHFMRVRLMGVEVQTRVQVLLEHLALLESK